MTKTEKKDIARHYQKRVPKDKYVTESMLKQVLFLLHRIWATSTWNKAKYLSLDEYYKRLDDKEYEYPIVSKDSRVTAFNLAMEISNEILKELNGGEIPKHPLG